MEYHTRKALLTRWLCDLELPRLQNYRPLLCFLYILSSYSVIAAQERPRQPERPLLADAIAQAALESGEGQTG